MHEKKKEIINTNLERLFSQCAGMDARLRFQAHELASIIDECDTDTALELIQSEYQRTLPCLRTESFKWLFALSEILYEAIGEKDADEHLSSLFFPHDETDGRVKGKISYLRNRFTEKAFDKFSKSVEDAKIMHAGSFEDSCVDAYNGLCEYCILPIENSSDGKLSAFYRLIEKYDLHIVASTRVRESEGASTTVALLSRDANFTKLSDLPKGRMLEFELTCADSGDIGGIIGKASSLGMRLERIDSNQSAEGTNFTLVLSAENTPQNAVKLLIFCLSAIYPSFSVNGFYRHIN